VSAFPPPIATLRRFFWYTEGNTSYQALRTEVIHR